MGWFWGGLIYVASHSLAGWLLAGQPVSRAWFGSIALLVPPALLAGVIASRRRQWLGCQGLFWATIGVGALLWTIGHVGWTVDVLVFGRQHPWLAWHTLFTLSGGVALVVAMIAAPHRGSRESAAPTVAMDIAGSAILLLYLIGCFILVPGLMPDSQAVEWPTIAMAAQALRVVLLAALVWSIIRAGAREWQVAYARLAGAVALGFIARAVTGLTIEADSYGPGTPYDLAWIVPYLGFSWVAATVPASIEMAGSEPETSVRLPHLTFASATIVLLAGYAAHVALPLGAPADSFRDLLTAVTVLALGAVLAARFAVQRAQLREAGARVRLLAAAMQQTDDMILIVRKGGLIEEVNDACCRMLGYARAELVGRRVDSLFAPESARLEESIRAALRTDGTWRGSFERQRRDGTTFPVACAIAGLVDRVGRVTHYVSVERDVTEDHGAPTTEIHTERLSAIGELAAGVAHEINNPLQTILGRSELLLADPALKTARRADVDAVRQEATRVAQIVRNLLSFVRRSSGDRAPVDLCEIVRSLTSLRAYPARQENLVIETSLPDVPLVVEASRDAIQQVLTNLLLNAEHAARDLPGQGTVSVRAWGDAEGVHVEVADDGPGVSAEIRDRIFEPFFTTKAFGEGTGLGLSTAMGIARTHGGRLELVPSPRGACFRLTLPHLGRSD